MSSVTPASLLPPGYLSTSGAQIVGPSGAAVRLEAIGWFSAEGPAGTTLGGLPDNNPNNPATQAAIQGYLTQIVSEGFNTVRIPWSDVNLQASLPLFAAVVAEAGTLGLKVIFDHHDDNGHYSQQPNGLWFDAGAGSDGTDGAGDTGTISAAQFETDTVTLARAFAGNSTVIGFDLDNEPLVDGDDGAAANWGQGGPDDILAMYDTVGSAVEAADPGALIIAEGPQNWTGTLLDGQPGLATEGDLSEAAARPVTLTVNGQGVAGKVVYSVHEYPSTIGGEPTDSGASYIRQMNAAWGYLEAANTAPVWVGEMGGSFDTGDGTDSDTPSQLANEQAWAATIVPYLNGQDAGAGGPGVATGFDWWASGNFPYSSLDGYNSGPNGSVNAGQEGVASQLMTYHQPPASPLDTVVKAGTGGAITDSAGNTWTITAAGQVAVNGVADATTANVTELAYVGGTVWQENASSLWWGKSSPAAAWSPTPGTSVSPLPVTAPAAGARPSPPASPLDTVVKAGTGGAITDSAGNTWTITTAGQVAVNGVADATTANVTELAYVGGTVWQENASSLWWGKSSPAAAWSPTPGTSVSPLPGTISIGTAPTNTTVTASNISVNATAGNQMLFIKGSGDDISLAGGADTVTDTGGDNTYVVPAAGHGSVTFTFTSSLFGSHDMLDLRAALAATGWNGSSATLSGYLSVKAQGSAAVVSLVATPGGAATPVVTFANAAGATLPSLLPHMLT